MRDPGLKPWAVLYSRFAAKSDKPLRDKNLSANCPRNRLPITRLTRGREIHRQPMHMGELQSVVSPVSLNVQLANQS
jgi:hypothetical protein